MSCAISITGKNTGKKVVWAGSICGLRRRDWYWPFQARRPARSSRGWPPARVCSPSTVGAGADICWRAAPLTRNLTACRGSGASVSPATVRVTVLSYLVNHLYPFKISTDNVFIIPQMTVWSCEERECHISVLVLLDVFQTGLVNVSPKTLQTIYWQ